ncbi:MAG: hypothetical protein Kow00133_01230 [Amphiplicatus sp.]
MWMKSAPAAATAATSSPRRAKSADRIDGATRTRLIFETYRDARTLRNWRARLPGRLRKKAPRRSGAGDAFVREWDRNEVRSDQSKLRASREKTGVRSV